MSKVASKSSNQKRRNVWLIVVAVFVALFILLWLIATLFVPLAQGDGVNKYNGVQRKLAERIVELTKYHNGPQSPSLTPRFMYHVSVDEIHPVTEGEKNQFCNDPDFVFDDPADFHFYSATVTEGYLLGGRKTTKYIGCYPDEFMHREFFGDPKEHTV